MSSTYRDSAKKLDCLFDDFMKKVNTNPSLQSQTQQLQQTGSQQGLNTQKQNQRSNLSPYMNSSSPYNATDIPSLENRSLAHSNSAFQIYSQQTGTSSNGFQGAPPLPVKQSSGSNSQFNRKNSLNQINQDQNLNINVAQVEKDNLSSNQQNEFEFDENNQYFHDTFQNMAGKEQEAQPIINQKSLKFGSQQQSVQTHQMSFNQRSIDGNDNSNNRIYVDTSNKIDDIFPSAQSIMRGIVPHPNQENKSLNSNLNSYVLGNPSNQGSVFGGQNQRQNIIFESNQQMTYGSQMTSKRQVTEGSVTLGYGTSISTTQRESKAYANAMKALQAKIKELQIQLESKEKEMRNEREQHQDNIFNMQTIINEREEELRENRRQFEESERQKKEMQLAFEAGDAEKTEIFERMEADLSLLNTQLNECRNKQSKTKEELLSEKSARQSLEEDLLQLKQENQETKMNFHKLQADHRMLQDEKEEINRKYQSEKMQKEEHQIKSESRQRDLQKMKEHYNEQLREFQNELNLLETNYSRKISDLEKRISLLQEENEEQKHLIDVKNVEIEQLQINLQQKQNEWEETRVRLITKQRKLIDQIHTLKQHKAASTISSSSSRRNLNDHHEEDILLSSNKSRTQKKLTSSSSNQQVANKSRRNSSTSRSPTPSKQMNKNGQLIQSFSNTTIAANTQRVNNSEMTQLSSKRNNNTINEQTNRSIQLNDQANNNIYSQNTTKSPINEHKIQQKSYQFTNQTSLINNNTMRSSSQSPPPQSRSPNNVSPISRGHSKTLPSTSQFKPNSYIQSQQQQQQQPLEGTARLGVLNQENFDTPLFQNELIRQKSSREIAQQSVVSTIDYEQHQGQQHNQVVGQLGIAQNELENDEKGVPTLQMNNDSFFYNQYIMGPASTNTNQNNQINNNSTILNNNSRLNVSQLQNYSHIDQSQQLNLSNNNISYTQSQSINTVQNQNTNTSTTQGQETNDRYEFILKQIIEAEKESISLSSQFQNILNESGKTEDSKKKHEYRGRLIELNEQINKNNQKLFALKRKEQEFLDQMNSNF
ncbi:hypothetical protein TTHERM_00039270 (macronuclear) [Tetrahymena thermophila SB210]|uniref:Uncharacterized protein n=1 Tax=Tetrahymena thermophila (strain SB210) TaxID=312017 RepID=Q22LZ2_TETTS|nr:hypothetical protein TTHERM_00039270 [Tetrahymena thermophila SB210]EAR86331.2 hypothetical protein TTHERM_00039270 [Tetrahymena thermophila SB210]|eukprot:XP_977228.2 hypothetical protein TTHERM_00039270 [Tetrahymena thermophila SB210]